MPQSDLVAEVLSHLRNQLTGNRHLFMADADEIRDSALARLKDIPPQAAVEFVLSGLRLVRQEQTWFSHVLNQIVGGVLRRKLPFTEDQVVEMIELVSVPNSSFPFKSILKAAESLRMTPRLAKSLSQLRPCITEFLGGSEMRDIHARIDVLLNGPAPDTTLEVQGAWSQIVFEEISASPLRSEWERIFLHTAELRSTDASKKWRSAAQRLVQELGANNFMEASTRWLALGPSPKRSGVQISSGEAELQKGFLWFMADQSHERLPRLIANFAEGALKKIPMIGAVSQKVGNACVNVLAELPGLEPVSQLSRLAQRIKYDTAQRLIEVALTRAAEKAGVSREQLEELSASDCGLGADGTLTLHFGDYVAQVSIEETTSVAVHWSDKEGKVLKSVPSDVKEHHADEWKELQRNVKDMEKQLSAHRSRVERLMLTQRVLAIETLQTRYLNHPLLADMSRRLIWQFESELGIWHKGRIISDTEREIDLASQPTARLWHPVFSDVNTIFHWRCWLEDQGICQPFKQAHREVYLLTDAEREMRTYSNRFAGHIVRQHPFAVLCEQRGWKYRVMGQWDSHNTPTLELPQFGLCAQYDVDFPQDESEVSSHMVYLLIRTGAVRFVNGVNVPQELDTIAPVVFSEVMRDIDLFTAVASIGSDPAWGQRQPIPFRGYWDTFSFGELTEMAGGRRSLLERIIPRLVIRDRCALDGRFLVVRGDRATYRIHLGSGNVLMEPGSRYLCIVEGAATKATPRNLPLPFEGDHKLSLILSKAFLLANDRKIKDETILRQLPALQD
jgi:hypothetical protein